MNWTRLGAVPAMTTPNLFDYATNELSQDALICWLIDWAGAKAGCDPEKEALRRCGRRFVEALFAKWSDYPVELGDRISTEVLRQERRIDILARVDGKYVLLIEDKTRTRTHDDQLDRYWNAVVGGKTRFKDVDAGDLYPIYFKTGNHSLKDCRFAEEQEYAVFDRRDFLSVLNTYRGTNQILIDFRRHLGRWEEETHSFRDWTEDGREWSRDGDERCPQNRCAKRGWEGLYRCIEESIDKRHLDIGDDEWAPLGSRFVGGYNGISVIPEETSDTSRFEIWIEENRISFRLYGELGRTPSTRGMKREMDHWAAAFDGRGDGSLRFTHPRRLQPTKTKPMCVSECRSWLAFGRDGKLDVDGSIGNLNSARKVLLNTIRRRRSPR